MTYASIRDPLLLSPPIPVEWAGFTSRTDYMQRWGWDFVVEAGPHLYERHVLARHRANNTVLYAVLRDEDVMSRALVYNRGTGASGFNGPPIRFGRATHAESFCLTVAGDETHSFVPVDMTPQVVDIREWSGLARDLFRPWAPQAQEILVEPETVTELFEKIKRLQAPELSAIRERNRARDYREQRQESVVAQIITLAA